MAREAQALVLLTLHLCLTPVFLLQNVTNDCVEGVSGAQESKDFPYLGCYHSDCLTLECGIHNNSSMDIWTCTEQCAMSYCAFAGLLQGTDCLCGNFVCDEPYTDKRVCDSHCGIPCFDTANFQLCGGDNVAQIYQVRPWITETMVTTDEIGQDGTLTQIMTTDQSSTSSPIGTEHAVHQNTTDPSQPTGNPHENLPYKIIFVLSLVIILICCVFIVYFCRRGHRRESRSTEHASEYRVSKNEAMTSIGIDSRDLDCGGIRANQITIRTPSPRLYLPTCATAVETKASIHDSPVDGDDDDSQSKSDDEYYDMTKWYRTSDHAIHIDPVDEPKMSHVPMETSSGDGRHLGNALRPLGRTPSSRSDRLYDSIPSHGHKRHHLKHCYPTCHTSLRQGYSEWKVPDGESMDIPHYQNIRF